MLNEITDVICIVVDIWHSVSRSLLFSIFNFSSHQRYRSTLDFWKFRIALRTHNEILQKCWWMLNHNHYHILHSISIFITLNKLPWNAYVVWEGGNGMLGLLKFWDKRWTVDTVDSPLILSFFNVCVCLCYFIGTWNFLEIVLKIWENNKYGRSVQGVCMTAIITHITFMTCT